MPAEPTDERWQELGRADELAKSPIQQIVCGRTKIALIHRDGVWSAISGVCNHVGGPLGEGRLDGDYVVCPWHAWKFHWRTGLGEPGFEEEPLFDPGRCPGPERSPAAPFVCERRPGRLDVTVRADLADVHPPAAREVDADGLAGAVGEEDRERSLMVDHDRITVVFCCDGASLLIEDAS